MSDAPGGAAEPTAGDAAVEPETAHGAPVSWSRGQRVVHPTRERYLAVVKGLIDDGFEVCVDVTAVDYRAFDAPRDLPEGVVPERFEVVVGLLCHARAERLRLRVQVPESDPTCPSLFDVHPGVEALEREASDMFGVVFEGHPDPTRILMPEDWEGFPLRKDAAIGRIPVQFKAPTDAR